jgi:hypothetical protein
LYRARAGQHGAGYFFFCVGTFLSVLILSAAALVFNNIFSSIATAA